MDQYRRFDYEISENTINDTILASYLKTEWVFYASWVFGRRGTASTYIINIFAQFVTKKLFLLQNFPKKYWKCRF